MAQVSQNQKWRAIFTVGVNFANANGFVEGFTSNSPNIPTVTIGLQHMLKRDYGLRLDYNFNRLKNDENTPSFKINYSRVNLQFLYNLSSQLVPSNTINILAHSGFGYSFSNALGGLDANNQSYFNLIGGLELGYNLSRKVTLIGDVSYIHGLTSVDNYNPAINGLGAFNGDVVTATIGISLALSGCATCN